MDYHTAAGIVAKAGSLTPNDSSITDTTLPSGEGLGVRERALLLI
jgi:hypothetical protein